MSSACDNRSEFYFFASAIPMEVDLTSVCLYFMHRRNGGCGDVKSVDFIDDNSASNTKTARVTVEMQSTVDSILEKAHQMNGSTLELFAPDKQIFSRTTTVVLRNVVETVNKLNSPGGFASICPSGVTVENDKNGFKLTGEFDQIQLCRDRIAELLRGIPVNSTPLGLDLGNMSLDDSSGLNVPTMTTPKNSPANSTSQVRKSSSVAATAASQNEKLPECVICLCEMLPAETIRLDKCRHQFHRKCVTESFRLVAPVCPICKCPYGVATGTQPENSRMTVTKLPGKVPGYQCDYHLEIKYEIPHGIQGPEHPNPGQHYKGTTRTAYLPDTPHGRVIAQLLRKAFEFRLVFSVGTSVTSGEDNVVVWNGIHHKTSLRGGSFGYPDQNYLDRVERELADFGLVRKMVGG